MRRSPRSPGRSSSSGSAAGPAPGCPRARIRATCASRFTRRRATSRTSSWRPPTRSRSFEDSFEAFNWADRYQMPVVVLVDKYLSTQHATVEELKMDNLSSTAARGSRQTATTNGSGEDYLRFELTDNGVSPRSVPGRGGRHLLVHQRRARPARPHHRGCREPHPHDGEADGEARSRRPRDSLRAQDQRVRSDDADVTLVGWGSVKGSVLDAMDVIAQRGRHEAAVRSGPARCGRSPSRRSRAALGGAKRLILVEDNYTGQLGGLVREMTGIDLPQKVLKYDGRPFSEEEMVEALRQAIAGQGGATSTSRTDRR